MIAMLVFGTSNTLIQKMHCETVSAGNFFPHPYFQCAIMFVGEFSALFVYLCKKGKMRHDAAKKSEEDMLLAPGT